MTYIYPNEATFAPGELQVSETFASVMRHVYLWMCLGLCATGLMAALMVYSPLVIVLVLLAEVPLLFYALLIGELVLVWQLQARIHRLSINAARAWFLVYAVVNGITLSFIFLAYTMSSIALAFGVTAGLFGVMGLIGYTNKMDLSKWGSYLLMGLVGLLIASLVNMFFASSELEWLLTYFGILLFLGLTIYDTQRIKQRVVAALAAGDAQVVARVGVLGALSLYLDFINLFLKLLRILGRRRRR